MHKKLRKIMKRDNEICGIHSGGCMRLIMREAKGGQKGTKDHIIPERYASRRIPDVPIHDEWNLQPMHRDCNNARKGQILSQIKFECSCHGSYVDEQQNRWMMYKDGNTWNRVKYMNWGGPPSYGAKPGGKSKGELMRMHIQPVKTKTGWHFDIAGTGHNFIEMEFYRRLLHNAIEFDRTEQWEELAKELETFCTECVRDGGASLQWESQGPQETPAADRIAWIIYWAQRIEEQNLSAQFIGPNTRKIVSGKTPLAGVKHAEAEYKALSVWQNEALKKASRYMSLREWDKAEAKCDEAIKRNQRPNEPETIKVIAGFYHMKISAAKSREEFGKEDPDKAAEEAAKFFESICNNDSGPIREIVEQIITERDTKNIDEIVQENMRIFNDLLKRHIQDGRLEMVPISDQANTALSK